MVMNEVIAMAGATALACSCCEVGCGMSVVGSSPCTLDRPHSKDTILGGSLVSKDTYFILEID